MTALGTVDGDLSGSFVEMSFAAADRPAAPSQESAPAQTLTETETIRPPATESTSAQIPAVAEAVNLHRPLAADDDLTAESVASVGAPMFSDSRWTRLGGPAIDGDEVTENWLAQLADRAEKAARAQGFSAGWAEGRREAAKTAEGAEARRQAEHQQDQARREAEHRQALENLAQAASAMRAAVEVVCAEVNDRVIDVTTGLTRHLVDHELALSHTPGLDAVQRALDLVPEATGISLTLSPDDAADVSAALPVETIRVVVDSSMKRGDVLMEFDDGAVDLRISHALERVCAVLEEARDEELDKRTVEAARLHAAERVASEVPTPRVAAPATPAPYTNQDPALAVAAE